MSHVVPGRRLPVALVAPALAIFLLGTNLCVLAAVSGGAACSRSAAAASHPRCPQCAHHAAGKSGTAALPSLSPCCLTLVPSHSIHIDKAELTAGSTLAIERLEVTTTSALRRSRTRDERPPKNSPALDLHLGRAPPQA